MTKNHGAILTTMTKWYTPAEVLKIATATNAELLALSGSRNPYPGKLGALHDRYGHQYCTEMEEINSVVQVK
jgi:hypothetical protein